jgi:hypothetical protein
MKRGLDLDRVVLLGRTFEEYVRSFSLNPGELRHKAILDVAAGVSSFCAEANEQGLNVTATDLIYNRPCEDIEKQCAPDLAHVVGSIGDLKVYRWGFYGNPQGMRQYRERAYRRFLRDYKISPERYCFAQLPKTPFADREFNFSLISYLLFVYEEQLSYAFHKASMIEIMRITSEEARFYPIVTFEAERSVYLDRLKTDPDLDHLQFEEVPTEFEFLANSNSFLRVRHKKVAG